MWEEEEAMVKQIHYLYFDGRPALCTRLCEEAWWVPAPGGRWRKADLPDICNNAHVISKQTFERLFPDLPPLPKGAFKI